MKGFNQKLKKLFLYKDGEPFLNKNLGRMIAYAKKADVTETVEVTSNGSLITPDRAIEILEASLDAIRISVEHIHDDGYRKVTQTGMPYEQVRKNVEFLHREKQKRSSRLRIDAKIVDVGLTKEEKDKFIRDFSPIADTINIDTLMGWGDSDKKDFTLGFGETIRTGQDGVSPLKKNRVVCPNPFKTMAVNFNGEVSVCSVDWSFGTIVGDVGKENLMAIWNGEKMRQFRLTHLRGERKSIPACSNCHYVLGMHPYNDLDDHTQTLLNVYSV